MSVNSPAPADERGSRRVLDPVDRVSEILFGLIMALTFTCTLSVAEAGRADVREMLVGALGCNLAWGIVDATIFVLMALIERARGRLLIAEVRASADAEHAHRLIAAAVPPVIAPALDRAALAGLRAHLLAIPDAALRTGLRGSDWVAAIAVFLLVVLSTFPVAIPFMLTEDLQVALRVSNGIAIAMLYACGAVLGRYAGRPPWRIGLVMAALGVALVAITIALGG